MRAHYWQVSLAVLLSSLAALVPARFVARAQTVAVVHVLDAGTGDAAWVALPNGATLLIDCGPPDLSKQLLLQLQTAGVNQIDLLAVSRTSPDAAGGCADVVRYLNVRAILWSVSGSLGPSWRALDSALTTQGVSREPVGAGWSEDVGGGVRLTLLNPQPSLAASASATDDSQVVLLEYGPTGMLFSGAIHGRGEQQVIPQLAGHHIGVLRVADHGTSGTASSDFLDAVFAGSGSGPRLSIVSDSSAGGEAQAAPDVLAGLAGRGQVLTTAQNGAVTVTLDPSSGATWSAERGGTP